jgi:hypothetical protein
LHSIFRDYICSIAVKTFIKLTSIKKTLMYLIPIAWLYVVLMMAVAEASNTTGTVLGALITFVLYGLLPVLLVVYLMRAPTRRRAIKAREALELAAYRARHGADRVDAADPSGIKSDSVQPDGGGHAPTDAVAPVRKKP